MGDTVDPSSDVEVAAERAKELIAADRPDALEDLLGDVPALLQWRGRPKADGEEGDVLLQATTSYANFPGAEHEDEWNRRACAEVLLNRGALVDSRVILRLLDTGAHRMLALFADKGALPDNLRTRAALGSLEAVRECFDGQGRILDWARPSADLRCGEGDAHRRWPDPEDDLAVLSDAYLYACRLGQGAVAGHLLDACLGFDPLLAQRVAARGKGVFQGLMVEHTSKLAKFDLARGAGGNLGMIERTYLEIELLLVLEGRDSAAFESLLDREPMLTHPDFEAEALGFVEVAAYSSGTRPLLETWVARSPKLSSEGRRVGSRAISYALEYGHGDYVPVLRRVAPVPGDLPHAAGLGDLEAVKGWFDERGSPKLGDPAFHDPFPMHTSGVTSQDVLDRALAWAVVNGEYAVADFLLGRGADLQTRWSTHEPASILHECAGAGRLEQVKFLVSRGIDRGMKDARFGATAEGWAEFGGHLEVVKFLRSLGPEI